MEQSRSPGKQARTRHPPERRPGAGPGEAARPWAAQWGFPAGRGGGGRNGFRDRNTLVCRHQGRDRALENTIFFLNLTKESEKVPQRRTKSTLMAQRRSVCQPGRLAPGPAHGCAPHCGRSEGQSSGTRWGGEGVPAAPRSPAVGRHKGGPGFWLQLTPACVHPARPALPGTRSSQMRGGARREGPHLPTS